MEGKEINKEDDSLKSGSDKSKEEESDDFGLPEASFDSDSDESEEGESDDTKQEESYAGEETVSEDSDDSSDLTNESEESGFEFGQEEEEEEISEESRSYGYMSQQEEEKKSQTGLIIFLSLIGVIIISIAIYWFFFRTPKPEPVVMPPVEETIPEPVIEEPIVEEPVVEEEPVDMATSTGTYETINEKTGRYYIVINSFFDEDLAADYAKKLAAEGISTRILSPPERKGFRRVVLNEDFGNWRDAESRLGDLKMTYGDAIWVLKF